MSTLQKSLSLLLVLAMSLLPLAGCGNSSPPPADASSPAAQEAPSASPESAPAPQEELTNVNIGITPYSMYAIWAIAKELELDKEFGLNITLFDFTGTAQGAQACVRGDVDITASCVAEHLTSVVGAPNLVNFSPVGYFKGFFYVGRKGEIKPWDDLVQEMGLEQAVESRRKEFEGKAFCIIPQRKALILDTLAQVGLGERDVRFVNFADDQKAASAFMAGEGDFYIGSLPQQRMLLREDSYVSAGGSDILGPAGLWYDTMMTTEKYLADNQETCQKLLAVFYAAVYEFDKNSQDVAEIASAYLTRISGSEFSTEEWLDMQTLYDDFQSLDEAKEGFYNPDSPLYWEHSVQYQIDLQTAEGSLSEGVSAEQYYGGAEKLFRSLLDNQDLIQQIEAHK